MIRTASILLAVALHAHCSAQKGSIPDVSSTIKGDLILPIPFKNPLFTTYTENIGQVGLTFQVPVSKGFGLGIGGGMWWTTLKERALQPFVPNGDMRRVIVFGKAQYEHYTGPVTFYEASLKVGAAWYDFDCATCAGARPPVLYWAVGLGYFVHATENLAFGLTIGYDRAARTFSASDLGVEHFPGTRQTIEQRAMQDFLLGLCFSTRLRRSDREAVTW